MRKNFGAKPWVYPQPVLMIGTYDENGTPENEYYTDDTGFEKLFLCINQSIQILLLSLIFFAENLLLPFGLQNACTLIT